MRWSTEKKDIIGRWPWGQRDWTKPIWKKVIRPFLCDYEKKKWFEITQEKADGDQRHKFYPVELLCGEARKRLEQIGLDDLDEVFRFRFGNKPRLYGFVQHIFYVVWWDPEHSIYPTDIQDRGKVRR